MRLVQTLPAYGAHGIIQHEVISSVGVYLARPQLCHNNRLTAPKDTNTPGQSSLITGSAGSCSSSKSSSSRLAYLCACWCRVADHALKHVGGYDYRLATAPAEAAPVACQQLWKMRHKQAASLHQHGSMCLSAECYQPPHGLARKLVQCALACCKSSC